MFAGTELLLLSRGDGSMPNRFPAGVLQWQRATLSVSCRSLAAALWFVVGTVPLWLVLPVWFPAGFVVPGACSQDTKIIAYAATESFEICMGSASCRHPARGTSRPDGNR